MKYKNYPYIIFILFLFMVVKCQSQCKDSLCLYTSFFYVDNSLFLRLEFTSKIENDSIEFFFDNKAFIVDCPFYQEDQTSFIGVAPKIQDLKFSQLIIENEKGNFRVYSSKRFYSDNDTQTLLEVNCAFAGIDYVVFSSDNKESVRDIIIEDIRDLQVDDNDKKIRLHYYFKPHLETNNNGFNSIIITSNNWLRLDI
jgi:hypothetical protein